MMRAVDVLYATLHHPGNPDDNHTRRGAEALVWRAWNTGGKVPPGSFAFGARGGVMVDDGGIVRGQVLPEARPLSRQAALGASPGHILARHIIPNTLES
jgi:hypothetical protein